MRPGAVLCRRLEAALGETFPFVEGHVQNATFHADIRIAPGAALRLGNFGRLATVVHGDSVSSPKRSQVVQTLEELGYEHVPDHLSGSPLRTGARFTGDLFDQLCDYR